jgi:hypothetical protein
MCPSMCHCLAGCSPLPPELCGPQPAVVRAVSWLCIWPPTAFVAVLSQAGLVGCWLLSWVYVALCLQLRSQFQQLKFTN